jgi:recombination protein RecA
LVARRSNKGKGGQAADSARRSPLKASIVKLLKEVQEAHDSEASFLAASIKRHRAIPTGSLALDIATGIGGWPAGRIVEIYGPEGGGKSTLALSTIARVQAGGGYGAIIDTDMALDGSYATRIGIDPDRVIVSRPDTAEQAFTIAETLVRSGAIDVLVIDSLPALVPRAEIEGEMGEDHEAAHSDIISQAVGRLTRPLYRTGCLLMFVNQVRLKEGVKYGNPETTPGGQMLRAQASMRVDLRSKGLIRGQEGIAGKRIRAKITKSKVAPPFRVAEFDLLFGQGICKSAERFDLGQAAKIITRRDTDYVLGTVVLGRDRAAAIRKLSQDHEAAAELDRLLGANAEEAERALAPYAAQARRYENVNSDL